jgi:hypothetical protein
MFAKKLSKGTTEMKIRHVTSYLEAEKGKIALK